MENKINFEKITKEIKKEFNETFNRLTERVAAFDANRINIKPAENKWSAAQVARHLIKANSGLPAMLNGEKKDADRAPDEMVERIKSDFLNFGIKMEAPDFIVPEDKNFDQDELIEKLERVKSDIAKTIENTDLSQICSAFEFPVYGFLTGIEMLSFAVYHTQRHLKQLEKVAEKVK